MAHDGALSFVFLGNPFSRVCWGRYAGSQTFRTFRLIVFDTLASVSLALRWRDRNKGRNVTDCACLTDVGRRGPFRQDWWYIHIVASRHSALGTRQFVSISGPTNNRCTRDHYSLFFRQQPENL
jgi:ligand-binding SRPBCC domain-containing protein